MSAVLLLAAALRFTGLGWGFPAKTSFHPDEDKILWQLERMRLGALDLDPQDFGWGTLQTYLVGGAIFALDRLGAFGEGWRRAFREGREPHFERLFVTGRAVSALLGMLTVAVVAAIARERAGARAGVLAASLMAVSPLHVLHSHYLTADVALGFWLAFAFWALPRSRPWGGFLLGLAIATKPSALVVVPALLLFDGRVRGLGAVVAGFLAGEPYALLSFGDWWSANLAIAARTFAPAPEAFPIGELLARHAVHLMLYGLGPAAALAALAGLRERSLAWASGGLLLTLVLSRFPMGRYALPLLPFLAVAASLAMVRLPRGALMVTLPLALLPPLSYSAAQVSALFGLHPHQQASAWIESTVPAGASVARLWAEYPPLDAGRHRLSLLEDPFGLQGRAYRSLLAELVVLDDLPLHAWRPELLADLHANYAEVARFGRPLVLPEPWSPHDSRYPRPEVTVYRRLGAGRARVERDESVPAGRAVGGRALGDGDARILELAEDVGAVPRRAHPLLDHLAGASLARGEVLAHLLVAVAAPAHGDERRRSVGARVIEVALSEHVAHPVLGGGAEPAVQAEERQPASLPLVVHGVEQRDRGHACPVVATALREGGHG